MSAPEAMAPDAALPEAAAGDAVVTGGNEPPAAPTAAEQAEIAARREDAVLTFARRVNAQPHLSVLMQDAGAIVAEVLAADFSGVGEVVSDGKELLLTVNSTDPEDMVVNPVVRKSSLDAADSLAAWTLDGGNPVVVPELGAEKKFSDLFLRKLGVVGTAMVPLHSGDHQFGTLGAFCKEKRTFTPDDVSFTETIAHLLTSAIARAKAEQILQKERTIASVVSETVDLPVVVLDANGKLVDINRACCDATGRTLEEVRGRPYGDVFAIVAEIDSFQKIFRQCLGAKSPCRFESHLLAKDGGRRKVAWSAVATRDEEDEVQCVILVGVDGTSRSGQPDTRQQTGKPAEEIAQTIAETLQNTALGDPAANANTADTEDGTTGQPVPPKADKPVEERRQGQRRSSQRRNFNYEQHIAPIYSGMMPTRKSFFAVGLNGSRD